MRVVRPTPSLILPSMRLQPATLQCSLAAIAYAFVFLNPLVHAAADESSPDIYGAIIGEGAGFPVALDSFNGLELRDVDAEDESNGLDLVQRYPTDGISMANNNFQVSSIEVGKIQYWYFPKNDVHGKKAGPSKGFPPFATRSLDDQMDEEARNELRKRADDNTPVSVYMSLTTCQAPSTNKTDAKPFDQLEVYVSLSDELEKPGPEHEGNMLQNMTRASGGYWSREVQAEGDVFVAVVAPNSTEYSGEYQYQIAVSIDGYFHAVDEKDPFLYFVDADMHAALLVTNNLTQTEPDSATYQEWMDLAPPYTMFAHGIHDSALAGLERSFCALEKYQVSKTEVGMTSRGLGNKPKQQFYITGLNRSSEYNGILAMVGNSTASGNNIVGGGGKLWKPMNFTTKADDNCAVLFNLTFCSEVAYAVPSNPDLSVETLRSVYDDYAAQMYQNFSYSLQQIQCNTTPESMYSLAVGCSNCSTAYKQWLCSVSIPRCADFQSQESYLQVRNAGQNFINGSSLPANDPLRHSLATNTSRNPLIDTEIKPGPYKEILPCSDICYSLVRGCPAALGFGCPTGKWLNASYGWRDPNGDITCSYLGAAYYLNSSPRMQLWLGVYMLSGLWMILWAFL